MRVKGCGDKTTKSKLVEICKRNRWTGYSKYKKSELAAFVERLQFRDTISARRIQTFYKYHSNKRKLYEVVNTTDFATLESFPENSVVFEIYDTVYKKTYRFNPRSLLDAMLTSGHFVNPYNRHELSDFDLRRLQRDFLVHSRNEPPLIFCFGDRRIRLNKFTPVHRLRAAITVQRQIEREQNRTVEFFSDQCERTHKIIIDLIVNVAIPDSETVSSVMNHVIRYHFPMIEEALRCITNLDCRTAQMVTTNIYQDIARMDTLTRIQKFMIGVYLKLLNALILRMD
jgi:hypothetical protein